MGVRSFYGIASLIMLLVLLPQCGSPKKETISKEEQWQEYKEKQHPVGHKKIERLTLEEAQQVYHYYKNVYPRDEQRAKVIERIVALSSDHDALQPLILELADLMFAFERYGKAEDYYTTYAALYPGSVDIDYIKMRTIQATFKQTSEARKDQSKTKDTIRLAENYILNFSPGNRYYKEIVAILQTCYLRLIESELFHIEYYLDRYCYTLQSKALESAWSRLIELAKNTLFHVIDPGIDHLRLLILAYDEPENTQPQDAQSLTKYLTSLQEATERLNKTHLGTVTRSMLKRF